MGRASGWFGDGDPDRPLLSPAVSDYVARNESWFWPVAALVAVLVCVLALLWLRAQLRLPRVANTDLVVQVADGEIRVHGDALAEALEDDATRSVEAARRVSARVTGDHHDLDVDLRIDLDDDGDLNEARRSLEAEVLPRFTQAACAAHATTYLDLRLHSATRRVR